MNDDALERAHESAVDALVDWSALPLGSGHNVHDILDDFETAIRAESQPRLEELEAERDKYRTAVEDWERFSDVLFHHYRAVYDDVRRRLSASTESTSEPQQ